ETDGENRPDAVHLRMPLQHALKGLRGLVDLIAVVKDARADNLNHRMFRFQRRPLIKLPQSLVVLLLIHEDARAIVTGHDTLTRIQPDHTIETAKRLLVIAVETSHDGPHKLHTRIVRILITQRLDLGARLLFLSTGEIDEHHVRSEEHTS